MPTKIPRIAVPRDSELERALERTRGDLPSESTRSAAAHVRALALHGANILDEARDDPQAKLLERLRATYDTRAAQGDLLDLGPPPGGIEADDPTPASDALDWVRGD